MEKKYQWIKAGLNWGYIIPWGIQAQSSLAQSW